MAIVVRTYRCSVCKTSITVRQESADDAPECETCHGDTSWVPGGFSITGAKSQAVEIVHRIAEKQFGMTDMNDGTREGDVAFKMTPTQSKMADNYWAGESTMIGQNRIPMQTLLAGAKGGPLAGTDPVAMLKKAQGNVDPLAFRTKAK